MSTNVFDTLMERGFIAQTTHEEKIRELLGNEKVTFYIGFDPTADSLHVGHLLQLIVMSHMQKAGHKPIALIGGGTAMVGDPSGRTDMRKMLTQEEINYNGSRFRDQMKGLVDFGEGRAIMVNNGDWLLNLNYVSFLREIGVHFSVNRMLSAECFKSRLERGLSFIEFNYMLMQSYDFLKLYQDYGCKMQLGGDDQWSNILGGVDLIRRVEGDEAYGMTFQLLTTSEGKKMGKTQSGAVWLDPSKTSPYDFYQYWRNVDDADVIKCLKLLTFIPMSEIEKMAQWKDAQINEAKKILAYEVTKIVHGEAEAQKAKEAAEALFGQGGSKESIPTVKISRDVLGEGMKVIDLLAETGLVPSKGEGRRLIQQGGLYVNENRVDSMDLIITAADFSDNEIMVRKGKKTFHRVVLE
ncbi:MAG TPA: tyrosine--tRNA ligase [Clostridiaceae bacterium]|nr:tyrosine--tRNA ligase [Clostridiaceae bacterium]